MKKFLLFMASLCVFATTACGDAPKVTDPADPKFKPENFRFEDYSSISQLSDAIDKLFPLGVPKEKVRQIIVDYGEAYETVPFYYSDRAKKFGKTKDGYFLFYYKPQHPAGEYGWDKTSSGWVLKMAFTEDDKYKHGQVLTIPQQQNVFAVNPFVTEAKIDLLMKIDLGRQGGN